MEEVLEMMSYGNPFISRATAEIFQDALQN